jgi:hypothetical protein
VELANHLRARTQDVVHALDVHPFMRSKQEAGPLRGPAQAAGLDRVLLWIHVASLILVPSMLAGIVVHGGLEYFKTLG